MKIIYLNAWGATLRNELATFLRKQQADTDIFCFQEADGAMPALCKELLYDYDEITAHKYVTKSDDFYQATYVKKNLSLTSSGSIFQDMDNIGLDIYVEVVISDSSLLVCNLHGMSRPTDKHDTPERVQQVQGLIDFCNSHEGPAIIGGDFNVFPSNASIQRFQKQGYQDLIQDYNITNTRNHHVWDRYPQNPRQYYSDYVFLSSGVTVKSFSAPDPDVSDHHPLLLEVTLQPSPQSTSSGHHELEKISER